MLKLLIKRFIKNSDDVTSPEVRVAYGTLCGAYGIGLNIILFLLKLFAGIISNSVAVTADAFNNLSDAGSSLITLLGFKLASKKPDTRHPYGYGRIEYFTGLLLSVLIIVIGVDLAKTSIGKIQDPSPVVPSLLTGAILIASILVKFYMSMYNRKVGNLIESAAMKATASDCLSDSISTFVVLISMILNYLFGINVDGWAGLIVAVFICYMGVMSIRETVSPLLGQVPDPELVEQITSVVKSHPEILGIHDMIIHDYGPGRLFASLHAEVDGNGNFYDAHDIIDLVEEEVKQQTHCVTTIHLDPIDPSNHALETLRTDLVAELRQDLENDQILIHDLRMVPGKSHTNLIFDVLLPADFELPDEDAAVKVKESVRNRHPNHYAVVQIDRSYV